ncbi:hypothetical protein P4S72_16560 [Vibrio sp. PP-XX7]
MTGIDSVLALQTIPPKWTGCLSPEEAPTSDAEQLLYALFP